MASPDVGDISNAEVVDRQTEAVNTHDGEKKPEAVLVIGGLARSGKSTALNNIFQANFLSNYSTKSVTKCVNMKRLVGEESDLIIVDTPGFGSTDLNLAKVRKDFLDSIGTLSYVLVYCFSVSPGNTLSVADEYVVKRMVEVMGKDIWKKCVILLTFSDRLRSQACPSLEDRDKYKEFISGHAQRLTELFKKVCGSHAPTVKSVFEVDTSQECIDNIIAVPVGLKLKQGKEKHELVPGIEDLNWAEVAVTEIIRKAEVMERVTYLHHFHRRSFKIGTVAGAVVGGAVGLAGGGVLGAATLGFGLAPAIVVGTAVGTAIGGMAGSLVGTTGGLTIGEVKYSVLASRNQNKIKKAEILRPPETQTNGQPHGEEDNSPSQAQPFRSLPVEITSRRRVVNSQHIGETPMLGETPSPSLKNTTSEPKLD